MREIKFRAWDEKKKEMLGSWNMHFFSIDADWMGNPNLCFGERIIGNPTKENIIHNIDETQVFTKRFKVMQFTGLKDKNGKEIYEGDLLEIMWEEETEVLEVVWGSYDDGEYLSNCECWMVESIPLSDVKNSSCGHPTALSIEVIGNIWENSELLK